MGLRSLLADVSGRRSDRRSSCGEIFEDPTYTAELAQREILVPLGNFQGELDQKKGEISQVEQQLSIWGEVVWVEGLGV